MLNPFGSEFWIFSVKGSFTPKNGKNWAFWGYPHAPRATAQGIHFRSTTIVQSVSGDARDVPLTTEFLGWSYGLGARSVKVAHFWKWRTFYSPGSGSTPQHIGDHAGRPYELTLLVSTVLLVYNFILTGDDQWTCCCCQYSGSCPGPTGLRAAQASDSSVTNRWWSGRYGYVCSCAETSRSLFPSQEFCTQNSHSFYTLR